MYQTPQVVYTPKQGRLVSLLESGTTSETSGSSIPALDGVTKKNFMVTLHIIEWVVEYTSLITVTNKVQMEV